MISCQKGDLHLSVKCLNTAVQMGGSSRLDNGPVKLLSLNTPSLSCPALPASPSGVTWISVSGTSLVPALRMWPRGYVSPSLFLIASHIIKFENWLLFMLVGSKNKVVNRSNIISSKRTLHLSFDLVVGNTQGTCQILESHMSCRAVTLFLESKWAYWRSL